MDSRSALSPPGGERSRERTCRQCRTRKVRCDGRRDICSNCARLEFDCSFQVPQTAENRNEATRIPSKCRVTRACVSCHSLKARCSGETPTCARCAGRGICCVYPPRGVRYPQIRPVPALAGKMVPVANPQTRVEALTDSTPNLPNNMSPMRSSVEDGNHPTVNMNQPGPDLGAESSEPREHTFYNLCRPAILTEDRIEAACNRYFHLLHRLPVLAFLHKPSLLQLYRNGKTGEALLLALVAVTSRLPGVESSEATVGAQCADLAEDLILKDIRRPSIFNVQALVLVVQYRAWTGSSAAAFSLLALSARFAFALRLNYESMHLPSFVQESRRRLMWTIYMVDTMLAEGLPEFAVCPAELIHLRLPCRDIEFELNFENETEELQDSASAPSPSALGMLAYYIRIIHLRDRILRCTKQAAKNPRLMLSTFHASLIALEKQLDTFALKLPAAESFSEENFRLRSYSWSLPRYVMTHLWWHQCYCDLFRCLLPGLRESLRLSAVDQLQPDFVLESQTKCFRHAQSIAEICSLLLDLDSDVLILDVEMAQCAYQAGRILCLGREMNAEGVKLTAEEVTEETTYCVLLIKRLSNMYPVVSFIAADLEEVIRVDSTQSLLDNDSPDLEHLPSLEQTLGMPAGGHTNQVISKHSMLSQTGFLDDSHKLEVSLRDNKRTCKRSQFLRHHRLRNDSSSASGVSSGSSASPLQTGPTNNPLQGIQLAQQSYEIEGEHSFREPPEAEFWDENTFCQRSWDELGLDMDDDIAIALLGPPGHEEALGSDNLSLGFNLAPENNYGTC